VFLAPNPQYDILSEPIQDGKRIMRICFDRGAQRDPGGTEKNGSKAQSRPTKAGT
jgi:hypothetical protein